MQKNASLLLVAIRYTYLLLSQLAYYCLNGPSFSNYVTSKLTPLLTSSEFYFSFLTFPHDVRFICKKKLMSRALLLVAIRYFYLLSQWATSPNYSSYCPDGPRGVFIFIFYLLSQRATNPNSSSYFNGRKCRGYLMSRKSRFESRDFGTNSRGY